MRIKRLYKRVHYNGVFEIIIRFYRRSVQLIVIPDFRRVIVGQGILGSVLVSKIIFYIYFVESLELGFIIPKFSPKI